MAIFRGVGGSGDSSDNSFLQEVTAQATTATNKANEASASATSAEASATSAANSLATIQNTEVTSASFNTGDGVLTLTKLGGATVTADLDGRFLTSYTETNDLSSAVTWVNVPNAYITAGSVTQHQAALTITESQISDLQSYLTSYTETNNLTTAVTWADVPDANITESSVTQHLTAANVTSPLTGGTGISVASNGTITNDSPDQTVALTGTGATTITGTYPNFTINSVNTTYTVGDGGLTTNDFTDADHSKLNGIEANATADQTGAEIKSAYEAVADTNAYTDAEKTKLSGIEASATADQTDAEIKTAYENNSDTNAFTDADHTKLDGLKGTLTSNYWDSMQWQQGAARALTTALTQYGDQQFVKHASSTYKTYVDLSLDLVYNSASGTNDAYGYLSVTAPPPAGETTVNMGPCVLVSSGVSYIQGFSVVGDWTEYFSRYVGISKNSDGSNAMGYPYKWVYSSNANRTTVWVSLYGNPPSNGDTIYLHPFDWESSGTLINGEQLLLDNSSSSGVSARRDFKLYLGRFYQRTGYRFQAKKISSSDVVTLDTIRMTTTEYEA